MIKQHLYMNKTHIINNTTTCCKPQDFKRKAGLGYAFVNLVTHDLAEKHIYV